jgi:hypothetical protein
LNDQYKQTYFEIQQLIAKGKTTMLLFKNVVRSGPKGSRNIRTGLSSFLEPLNDDSTKSYLQTLAKTTVQASFVETNLLLQLTSLVSLHLCSILTKSL